MSNNIEKKPSRLKLFVYKTLSKTGINPYKPIVKDVLLRITESKSESEIQLQFIDTKIQAPITTEYFDDTPSYEFHKKKKNLEHDINTKNNIIKLLIQYNKNFRQEENILSFLHFVNNHLKEKNYFENLSSLDKIVGGI